MAKDQQGGMDLGLLDDGTVVLQFPQLVREVRFTPQQAVAIGVGLIQNGTRGESFQRVQPPGRTSAAPRRKQ